MHVVLRHVEPNDLSIVDRLPRSDRPKVARRGEQVRDALGWNTPTFHVAGGFRFGVLLDEHLEEAIQFGSRCDANRDVAGGDTNLRCELCTGNANARGSARFPRLGRSHHLEKRVAEVHRIAGVDDLDLENEVLRSFVPEDDVGANRLWLGDVERRGESTTHPFMTCTREFDASADRMDLALHEGSVVQPGTPRQHGSAGQT